MDPMRVILWMVISSCIFAASVLVHRAFVEQSLFQKIYGKYRGNLEKRAKEENWFVSKYGVIEKYFFFFVRGNFCRDPACKFCGCGSIWKQGEQKCILKHFPCYGSDDSRGTYGGLFIRQNL